MKSEDFSIWLSAIAGMSAVQRAGGPGGAGGERAGEAGVLR